MRFFLVFFALSVFAVLGCSAPDLAAPEAGSVFLDVPDDAAVSLDGLHVGFGPQQLIWFVNYPNYLQVDDWKLIVWSAAGMDSLKICGESLPVMSVSPARVQGLE